MNQFWNTVKSLEGRKVDKVDEHVDGGIKIVCADGLELRIDVDADDLDLMACIKGE